MWSLVSDIWNGVDGDDGYYGCMTAVPDIDLPASTPNLDSNCAVSVENIVLRGGGPNGSLQWGQGSADICSVLTPSPGVHVPSTPKHHMPRHPHIPSLVNKFKKLRPE